MSPDAALGLCRVVHDAATMALWGAFAFLWGLVPAALAETLGRRLATFRTVAVIAAVATTAAALPLDAAAIGTGWGDAVDPLAIRAVLFETSVGAAWMAQASAALLLAATAALPVRMKAGATALASGLLLGTLALTGHAAMHEGGLGAAHRLADAVHVLAGGAWLGALVPLLPLLRALDDGSHRDAAGHALRRFSLAGHVAVAVVVATGAVNTMLVLGRWPTDWTSPYQAMLAAKIALVLLMTLLALANRYLLVPRIARSPAGALRALRQATVAELVLGAAVVGLVGAFGLLEPS